MVKLIVLALILEPRLEKVFEHIFHRSVCLKLDAGKSYYAGTAKERLDLFHHIRQVVYMAIGVLILIILSGKEIFDSGNWLQKSCFLGSLTCVFIPLSEMVYYRCSTGRHYKPGMNAKEMSAYHDFCQRYYRHSFSLNGEGRKKLRFLLLSIGIILLISLTTFSILT